MSDVQGPLFPEGGRPAGLRGGDGQPMVWAVARVLFRVVAVVLVVAVVWRWVVALVLVLVFVCAFWRMLWEGAE